MRYIHCLNNISAKGTDLLGAGYQLTDDLSQADGVLVRSAAMHDLKLPENLLAIARAGAGVNNIPLDACAERGIVVFNTPGANANAVKELVICGMLLASRGILPGAAWCREHAESPTIGKDAEKVKKAFAGQEIAGKTLGVIGLGAIGALVANTAIDLGMNVLGYDPYVSAEAAWRLSPAVEHVTNLDDVLHRSDYVTIHVPATDSTRGMIGAHELEVAKAGCIVLNFSRDTLVDSAAMADALKADRVASYVTDFATPAVMGMPNTIVLPHLGASTAEAEDNCAVMAVQQMKDYLENGNIRNSVNFPACNMGPVPADGGRIAVLHANVPDMLSKITGVFGDVGANIENLTNQARGAAAYTMLDTSVPAASDLADKLATIEGVYRVRIVK